MNVVEDRVERRYRVLRRLDGMLGGVDVVLEDIGANGLHVKHQPPVRLATEATISFRLHDGGMQVRLPAFVVWSRFTAPSDSRPYHTGLRVDDPDGVLKVAIDTLLATKTILLDEVSLARKRQVIEDRARARTRLKVTTLAPRIPDDVILLVRQARGRLQANPAEIVRWFNRAKFSLNEAGEQIHERDDVLAVWEYLERSVELSIIARILDER